MSAAPLVLLTVAAAATAAGLGSARLHRRPAPRRVAIPRPSGEPSTQRRHRRLIQRPPAIGAVVAVGAVAVTAIGPLPLAGAIGAVQLVRALARRRARRQRTRRVDAAFPDTVDLLVLTLHAGATPLAAIRELPTLAPAVVVPGIEAVVHRLDRGQRLADALEELPRLLGPSARPVADGIAAAERDGLPLTPLLERLAADSRSARRRAAEADARALPVRLSFPLVLCTLPSFLLLGIVPVLAGALGSIRALGG